MDTSNREAVAETVDRLIDEVGSWTGVTTGEHRYGGTEWGPHI